MVKALLSLLLLFTLSLSADEKSSSVESENFLSLDDVIVQEDRLLSKIQSFLDAKSYQENRDFINLIFDPKSLFYKNERVDAVKVIETLKENGLLKLFFKKPTELKLNFKTSGAPLFFVKIMGDTLRNIGYYRYVTTAAHLDSSEFIWKISLKSEYATDPLILENELHKSACRIIDVERNSATEWSYTIDMSEADLDIKELEDGYEVKLKRSLYAHWINASKIKRLRIQSSRRNRWYPYIAYYDASLHLLKVIKKERIVKTLNLEIPQNVKYIKISDLYTLKNVRDALTLVPRGSK